MHSKHSYRLISERSKIFSCLRVSGICDYLEIVRPLSCVCEKNTLHVYTFAKHRYDYVNNANN